jgi:hypothetical protein
VLPAAVTDEFLDASEMEKELFGRITLNPFCVTTFVVKHTKKDKLHTRLVNITPVPERTSANPTIITQQFEDNPLVTFYTPVTESGDGIRDNVLAGVHALADEVDISIDAKPETWNNFPYFPQVTVDDFQAGWYRALEGMQGQNRTFYNGGGTEMEERCAVPTAAQAQRNAFSI